jgi:hypothetical protein
MNLSKARSNIPEGIRTGDWFVVGDTNQHRVPASLAPPPAIASSSKVRRTIVRTFGCLAIAGTVFFVARLAMHAPARRALLNWSLFGQSDRLLKR